MTILIVMSVVLLLVLWPAALPIAMPPSIIFKIMKIE